MVAFLTWFALFQGFLLVIILPKSFGGQFNISRCEEQWSANRITRSIITFIIHSKGRSTLLQTFQSLLQQSRGEWLAMVVFDGLITNPTYLNATTNIPLFMHSIPKEILSDGRFCFQHISSSERVSNCAANIRNHGMAMTKTDWIGFVDDEDILRPTYLEHLITHASEYPAADVILFRSCQYFPETNGTRVIPSLTAEMPILNDVGISFALKGKVFHQLQYKFIPSTEEDFLFLDRLYNDHIPILLSEYNEYRVKAFDHEYCGQLGKRSFIHRNKDLPPKYADLVDCPLRTIAHPSFIFSEQESIFFRQNIKGLKSALHQALTSRCFTEKSPPLQAPIHILFKATEQPTSDYFIQMQLEQRKSFHFTPEYTKKLSKALQIWEFNFNHEQQRDPIPGVDSEVYFLPTMLTLHNTTVYQCPSSSATISLEVFSQQRQRGEYPIAPQNPFLVYRFGKYYSCEWNGTAFSHTQTMLSPCYQRNHTKSTTSGNNDDDDEAEDYCWSSSPHHHHHQSHLHHPHHRNHSDSEKRSFGVNPATLCSDIVDRKKPIDVLSFGLLNNSFRNQREKLCDQLSLSLTGAEVVCVQGIFNELLNYLVCNSKIIAVNHYFSDSALETHRIDPLLQAKRVVVAQSAPYSALLDAFYSPVIPLVPFEKMVGTIRKIWRHFDQWLVSSQYLSRVNRFVQEMSSNLDPLCFALSNLQLQKKPKNLGNQSFASDVTAVGIAAAATVGH